MTTIEKIKAEIERRIKENESWKDFHRSKGETTNFDDVKIVEVQSILSFLSTLESEKPLGLEEEFNHYCFDFKDPDTGEDIQKNQISFNVEDALNVARHFAQWGAEHLKK